MKKLLLIAFVTFGLSSIAIAQTAPAYVPANGLAGWWSFTGNTNDDSVNGNNGTSVGATLANDRNAIANAAYFFDGNSQIDCGTNASLNVNDCTLSAWVFLSTTSVPDPSSQNYQTIVSKYDSTDGPYALCMYGDKATVFFQSDSYNYIEVQSIASLQTNQWYHIVGTHSVASGVKLYINGELVNSDPTVFNVVQAPTESFRIGSQGSFYPIPILNGSIDDVGVWNRELTQQEIANLYDPQYTAIPDANFEQALIDLGHDTVIDGQVLTANINTITSLDVNSKSIANLTGIQNFVALTNLVCYSNNLISLNLSGLTSLQFLNCSNNLITSINLSGLTALLSVNCGYNQLTSINISGLTALTSLYCAHNQILSLNCSGLPALKDLSCEFNQLTSLDVSMVPGLINLFVDFNHLTSLNISGLTELYYLYCSNNQLTSIDVSGFTLLTELYANDNQLTGVTLNGLPSVDTYTDFTNNPALSCIQVDDIAASTANTNWAKDASASYSLNCSLGAATYEQAKRVAVFPNPTQSILSLTSATAIDNIIITDLMGKIVLHQKLRSNQVDIQHLAQGMYLLQAFSGEEKFQTKFVKE